MDYIDEQIEEFINEMNKRNISKNEQINYLKKYIKIINDERNDMESNLVIGTFISGVGLGLLCDIGVPFNAYISCPVIILGVATCLAGANKIKTKENIRKLF